MTTADDVKASMAALIEKTTAETNQRKAFVLYVQGLNQRYADIQAQLDHFLSQQSNADPDLDAFNQQLLAMIDATDGNIAAEAAAMNTEAVPTIHTTAPPVVPAPVVQPANPPVVSSIDPTGGTAGTEITITGSGFTDTESVSIGGTPVAPTDIAVIDDSTLKVIASAAIGIVAVTTAKGTSTDQVAFSAAVAPALTPVDPPAELPVIDAPVLPDPVVPAPPSDTSGTTTTGLTGADDQPI